MSDTKREARFKSGDTSAQDVQHGLQQERDRWVGRLRGLIRDRDQVPSEEILSLVNEVSTPSARESVSGLTDVNEGFKALVGRVAGALDAYQRYVPGSHITADVDNDDECAEFIFTRLRRSLVVAVDCFGMNTNQKAETRVSVSSWLATDPVERTVVPWDGEDEPWVQMLRHHIDWLRSP